MAKPEAVQQPKGRQSPRMRSLQSSLLASQGKHLNWHLSLWKGGVSGVLLGTGQVSTGHDR